MSPSLKGKLAIASDVLGFGEKSRSEWLYAAKGVLEPLCRLSSSMTHRGASGPAEPEVQRESADHQFAESKWDWGRICKLCKLQRMPKSMWALVSPSFPGRLVIWWILPGKADLGGAVACSQRGLVQEKEGIGSAETPVKVHSDGLLAGAFPDWAGGHPFGSALEASNVQLSSWNWVMQSIAVTFVLIYLFFVCDYHLISSVYIYIHDYIYIYLYMII